MINISNLTVKYDNFVAVNNISFHINKGELFALLGTNGAGKTTTINVLCSLKEKQSGTVFIDGENIDDTSNHIKDKISVVFQGSVLDNLLTVKENLQTRGALYNLTREELKSSIEYYVEKLELNDIINKRYNQLSGGQRRKVDIARALITNPQVLILDEPTTGLDPKTRIIVWQTLNNIRKEKNLTILLTTHYMEETQNADNVVIMHEGTIRANGTPGELKEKYAHDTLKVYYKKEHVKEIGELAKTLGYKFTKVADFLEIRLKFNYQIYDFLNQIKDKINNFELMKGDMDTVFLSVTGQKELEAQHD